VLGRSRLTGRLRRRQAVPEVGHGKAKAGRSTDGGAPLGGKRQLGTLPRWKLERLPPGEARAQVAFKDREPPVSAGTEKLIGALLHRFTWERLDESIDCLCRYSYPLSADSGARGGSIALQLSLVSQGRQGQHVLLLQQLSGMHDYAVRSWRLVCAQPVLPRSGPPISLGEPPPYIVGLDDGEAPGARPACSGDARPLAKISSPRASRELNPCQAIGSATIEGTKSYEIIPIYTYFLYIHTKMPSPAAPLARGHHRAFR
jgi:hypothetical protein